MKRGSRLKPVGILEVGFGNLPSLTRVLRQIGISTSSISSSREVLSADILLIPGVGSFDSAMKHLEKKKLVNATLDRCLGLKKPTLGICLGAQILLSAGMEGGLRQGIGVFDGYVRPLSTLGIIKSHTGWDKIEFSRDILSFKNEETQDFFFNHDYYFSEVNSKDSFANCNWNSSFVVGLQKEHTFAVQFHPEKSQSAGTRFLQEFFKTYNV